MSRHGYQAKAEHRAWTVLRRYISQLTQERLFLAAADGRIGAYGILLPLGTDHSEVYRYQWDRTTRQCRIERLDTSEVEQIEEVCLRHRLLRRAIAHVKKALALIVRDNSPRSQTGWQDWMCSCGFPLAMHPQNHLGLIIKCPTMIIEGAGHFSA